MTVILLIIHGLLSVLLIGALTHQCIACFGFRSKRVGRGLSDALEKIRPHVYANAVVVLYMSTVAVGAVIYPEFRLNVRPEFDASLPAATGFFEIKEHYSAVGLGLLPAYWFFWKMSADESNEHSRNRSAAKAYTVLLTLITWVGFLVGHVLNNIEGL